MVLCRIYNGLDMADLAPNGLNRSPNGQFQPLQLSIEGNSAMEVAAKLYGQGYKRPQVAKILAPAFPTERAAYRKLRKWERQKEFRDLVYDTAVVKMDLETPHILAGVTAQAKRGRVDAAKLALSIVDRYTDKSDQPTHMVIELSGLNRPPIRQEIEAGDEA